MSMKENNTNGWSEAFSVSLPIGDIELELHLMHYFLLWATGAKCQSCVLSPQQKSDEELTTFKPKRKKSLLCGLTTKSLNICWAWSISSDLAEQQTFSSNSREIYGHENNKLVPGSDKNSLRSGSCGQRWNQKEQLLWEQTPGPEESGRSEINGRPWKLIERGWQPMEGSSRMRPGIANKPMNERELKTIDAMNLKTKKWSECFWYLWSFCAGTRIARRPRVWYSNLIV